MKNSCKGRRPKQEQQNKFSLIVNEERGIVNDND